MSAPINDVIANSGPFPAKEFRTLINVLSYSKAPQVRLEALHHFLECWLPNYVWHLWIREGNESWTAGEQPSNKNATNHPTYSLSQSSPSQHVHLQGWIDDSPETEQRQSDPDELEPFSQFLLHLLLNYPHCLTDEEASPRMQELESSRLQLFSETINTLSERLNSGLQIWKELPQLLYISAAFLNAQHGFIGLRVDDNIGFESFGISEKEREVLYKHIEDPDHWEMPSFWSDHEETRLELLEADGQKLGWIGFAGKDSFDNDEISRFSNLDDRMIQTLANSLRIALGKLVYILKQERIIEQHRIMLDTVNTGIITTDPDLNILQVNRKTAEILQLTADQLVGSSLLDRIPKNGPLAEFIKQAVEQQDKAAAEQIAISARDDRSLNVFYSPLNEHSVSDSIAGHLFSLEDMTELYKLRNSFSTYVSDRVLKMVQQQEHRIRLGGERKKCVVLFCDIRGFTEWSETSEAEKVVETLNQYFTLMMGAVQEHQGEIDKIIGDELMAVYYPTTDQDMADVAEAAIHSATQMQESLKLLNELREEQNAPPVSFGIGINTGEVICGNIGSFQRMDYTVIGDTVNVASRLCDSAQSNQILVTEAFRSELRADFNKSLRALGAVTVKGKDQPLSIYELNVEKQ